MNVIELAKEKGSVSRKEIEKLLGVSQSICGRLLKQKLMDGQIVQQGKGKNTCYVLTSSLVYRVERSQSHGTTTALCD